MRTAQAGGLCDEEGVAQRRSVSPFGGTALPQMRSYTARLVPRFRSIAPKLPVPAPTGSRTLTFSACERAPRRGRQDACASTTRGRPASSKLKKARELLVFAFRLVQPRESSSSLKAAHGCVPSRGIAVQAPARHSSASEVRSRVRGTSDP